MLYSERFSRNMPTLSAKQQATVRKSRIAIIGLGGTGGFALENVVRMGAGSLALFDGDRFEFGNFNRQMLATDQTLDKRKVEVAANRALSINPSIKIKKFGRFVPGAVHANALASCDVVLDCTDSLATKLSVYGVCGGNGVPYVFCSASGSRGIVSVFRGYSMEKAFQTDEKKKACKTCASILSPAAALAGSLAAGQALNVLLGKRAITAPRALFFDIFDKRVCWKSELG